MFHVPNGGKRSPIEAAILKGLGVTAGVPDIIAIRAGHAYGLELKADGGKPTSKQIETMAALEAGRRNRRAGDRPGRCNQSTGAMGIAQRERAMKVPPLSAEALATMDLKPMPSAHIPEHRTEWVLARARAMSAPPAFGFV